jgi:predicted nucleic acid-binding protein
MTAFLLDTNVVSELVKPKPAAGVVAFMARESDLWMTVITLHELIYGAERAPDPARRVKLIAWTAEIAAHFADHILPVDRAVAETAGRLGALADAQGRPAAALDALIAAAALLRGLTIATRNTKDFEAFGVKLANPWDEAS